MTVHSNVREYFTATLGYQLDDPEGFALSISTNSACGESCRVAIDAFADSIRSVYAAFGAGDRHPKSKKHCEALVSACTDVVLCFIYG